MQSSLFSDPSTSQLSRFEDALFRLYSKAIHLLYIAGEQTESNGFNLIAAKADRSDYNRNRQRLRTAVGNDTKKKKKQSQLVWTSLGVSRPRR